MFRSGWLRSAWPHFSDQDTLTVPWKRSPDGVPTTPQDARHWITFARDAKDLGLDLGPVVPSGRRDLRRLPLTDHPRPSPIDLYLVQLSQFQS